MDTKLSIIITHLSLCFQAGHSEAYQRAGGSALLVMQLTSVVIGLLYLRRCVFSPHRIRILTFGQHLILIGLVCTTAAHMMVLAPCTPDPHAALHSSLEQATGTLIGLVLLTLRRLLLGPAPETAQLIGLWIALLLIAHILSHLTSIPHAHFASGFLLGLAGPPLLDQVSITLQACIHTVLKQKD